MVIGKVLKAPHVTGGLYFPAQRVKPKARRCFNRCGGNRRQNTRFENNQMIKGCIIDKIK
jgi:hypothetical protein